ncbi:Kexin [Leucoagaricus sp. SymC.cos]|nr:Kexin [Leucoagaricus sp. SymC.cos]
MRLLWPAALAFLLQGALAATPARRYYNTYDYYAIEYHPHSSLAPLGDVLQSLGVELVEKAGELENMWLVRTIKQTHTFSERDEPRDHVLERFKILQARANSPLSIRSDDADARRIVNSVRYLSRQELRQRVKRAPPPKPPNDDDQTLSRAVATRLGIQDPLFDKQWHLVNNEFPEHMMNATPVWEMGFTGKGIISSLVDDGLDYTSDDLAGNFVRLITTFYECTLSSLLDKDADDSYDFNDHEALPTPKNFDDHHGTRCAGQVAAVKNDVCGVGIAYESKVAGVRILSGPISDVDEAAALNYGFHNVSIYSCSWGPPDNGQSMEGPGYLIKKAVVNGINSGRGGKGSIFVFASGNGAAQGDQCNFDGYTNSIYSVTVAAIDYKGMHPYYSEACAANMIVAYSSGGGQHIVTTDKGKDTCATTHGGTSAAAPNAVGVFALALQARPDLSWRDVQHLCVETARVVNPDDLDWEKTAAGRMYSYKYGYGALDAYAFVKAAQTWSLVKPQTWLSTETIQVNDGKMDSAGNFTGGQWIGAEGVTSKMTITQQMLAGNNFEKLEHINVKVWIRHTRRGDVEVELVSPHGVKSVLASKRQFDADSTGFPGWTFMSVKHWGENPIGDWTIHVSDQNEPEKNNGSFLGWNMMLWGSAIDPDKTREYEVPHLEIDVLPPTEAPMRPIIPSASATKQHPKPTSHLPEDHGTKEGENSKPAFDGRTSATASPSASSTGINPTPDEGWFADMSNLISNQKWFFGATALVILFGIGAGVFFYLRRRKQRRAATGYGRLGPEEMSMSGLGGSHGVSGGGSGRTRELYDAFGEVSDDDDEYADENTGLTRPQPPGRSMEGLGFHSGFLDDEDHATTAGLTLRQEQYRDESDGTQQGKGGEEARLISPTGEHSSSTSTSGEGSWEHASTSAVA